MISNVDSLYATIDIKDYNESAKDLIEYLEKEKQMAKELNQNNSNSVHVINIGNLSFKILHTGDRGHAYILHNDNFELKLSQVRSQNNSFYPITINIRSSYIWRVGINEAWNCITDFINSNIGIIKTNKISRLDMCYHTDEICITENNINNFKGRFKDENIFRINREITGVQLGTRKTKKIFVRIYNKSIEINTSRKYWFSNIWINNNMKVNQVWNVEFELKRNFFKDIGIDTVEEALEKLKDLWTYLTGEWLLLTKNNKDRIERSDITEAWLNVQNGFNSYKSVKRIERHNQLESNNIALLPGLIGYLTSYSANINIKNLDDTLYILKSDVEYYIEQYKSHTYDYEVTKKIKLQGGE